MTAGIKPKPPEVIRSEGQRLLTDGRAKPSEVAKATGASKTLVSFWWHGKSVPGHPQHLKGLEQRWRIPREAWSTVPATRRTDGARKRSEPPAEPPSPPNGKGERDEFSDLEEKLRKLHTAAADKNLTRR